MRVLSGEEEREAMQCIEQAARIAQSATCERSKCGSVIVKDGVVLGSGFNAPTNEQQRRCSHSKDALHRKVTDKTCCVHAEQRAIMDALKHHSTAIEGSRLYFVRLDEKGITSRAGKPYCTMCSKLALDSGVAEFVLWHDGGITVYDTNEYNLLSYTYDE